MSQISFWLDYLASNIPAQPQETFSRDKWDVAIVGVKEDLQDSTQTALTDSHHAKWRKKWHTLPINPTLFSVSSLKSTKSVLQLLTFVEGNCRRILDQNSRYIPDSYRTFLQHLQQRPPEQVLIHWEDLYATSAPKGLTKELFRAMLQYLKSVGRIFWLETGVVITNPTLAPQIAAKFVSPEEVRLGLLRKECDKVQILSVKEIGCLLDIDLSQNTR